MILVRDVLQVIERLAPPSYAMESDNIGLLVGNSTDAVRGVAVCLDASVSIVERAKADGANLLVAHHPIIWNGLRTITPGVASGPALMAILRGNMHLIAAHTNWDCAEFGINRTLLVRLGLEPDPEYFPAPPIESKLIFFSPAEAVDGLVELLSEVGAGVIGDYSHCSFQATGIGTFFGHAGTDPVVGNPGELTRASEIRVEMVVPKHKQSAVIAALVKHHPYEVPAFELLPRLAETAPIVRTATRNEPADINSFWREVEAKLGAPSLAWSGGDHPVRRIGVVGGAAGGYWRQAKAAGCDTFISGEIPHHEVIEATTAGVHMVQAGHFATENPGMQRLTEDLRAALPDLPVSFYEPPAGTGGRPLS